MSPFPDDCPFCHGRIVGGALAHVRSCPDRPSETMKLSDMLEALGSNLRPKEGVHDG